MKKSLLVILLIMVGNIHAYSYFADNTTPFATTLKLSYQLSDRCTSADKVITVPANRVGVKIDDTYCCINTLKAWRVDEKAPKDIAAEESSPSSSCGTKTFVIYARPNGSVGVID